MRVLVCGGRDYSDYEMVATVLKNIHRGRNITLIIQGKAKGADALGKYWGEQNGIKVDDYPADWDKYGKAAGPMRNTKMLDCSDPDLVVAFKGGAGTKDMVDKAVNALVPVMDVGNRKRINPTNRPDFDFRAFLRKPNEDNKDTENVD